MIPQLAYHGPGLGWYDFPMCHADKCDCDACHAYHKEEGIEKFSGECLLCNDEIAEEIHIGLRCQHGEWLPSDGGEHYSPCPKCLDFYPDLKINAAEQLKQETENATKSQEA